MRRVRSEHVAELLHELVESGILSGDALDEHLVQRPDHLLHALEIARGHVPDHLLDVLEEGLRHAALELIHQLVELLLGIGA